MILEAIVTTDDGHGAVNVAPMGPEVDGEAITQITLKPFRSSRTFANLRQTGRAVVHLTDDVELIASTAIGLPQPAGSVQPLLGRWHKLVDCCRWWALEVQQWDDDPQRPRARCQIVHRGTQRDAFGFNRAKHAVVEAAILATRRQLLGSQEVRRQMEALRPLVEKTGGPAEHRAWRLLESRLDA